MKEENERTPTGDTTVQFKWIPQTSVGSNEVGTSNSSVEDAALELERLKWRLEAFEEREREREREALDGMREQNRRDTSRVRMQDVNVPILKSTEMEEYWRWKKSLLWLSECYYGWDNRFRIERSRYYDG